MHWCWITGEWPIDGINWTAIGKAMKTRSGPQCRKHWYVTYLSINIPLRRERGRERERERRDVHMTDIDDV
jgi:hypothetical protein